MAQPAAAPAATPAPPQGGATPNPPAPGNPPNPQTPPPKKDDEGQGQPAPKAKGSIYEDIGADPPGAPQSGAWAENWREQLATGDDGKIDEKALAELKRYSTPKDWHKAGVAARQRIRSGEYRRAAPPEGADEATVKAWREEQGIPATPDAYSFQYEGKPLDMSTLDEGAKAGVQKLQQTFHKLNLNQDQAAELSNVLVSFGEQQAEQTAAMDAEHFDASDDHLRSAWGADYKVNLKANWHYMEQTFGKETVNELLEARLPNGMKLANAPWFNEGLNRAARSMGGDRMVEGSSEAKGVDSRIAEIEAIMKKDMGQYLSTPGMADEYGALLRKREARG